MLLLERCTQEAALCQSRDMRAHFPNLPSAIAAYKDAGRTQAELAQVMDVTEATVSRWANGIGDPEVKILKKLAKELGVTVAHLAGEDEAAQTQHELDLLIAYRRLDPVAKAMVDASLAVAPQKPKSNP